MENTQISHYRVLRRVGGGGMGVVWAAEDLKLQRQVALKFLPDDTEHDPQALERLLREARAASALNHPNICTVHEIGEHNGRHFIVMELVEGTPLDQRINGRPLPLALLLDLAEQIADALDAAHAKGVVHRDIKPGNILVAAGNRVKVVDFGLAKMGQEDRKKTLATSAATAGVSQAHLTSPGVALGTVAYMSPEQARGEPLDARTDLFSFGAVLYEMATGTLPFQGATSAVIFDAILNREPPAPSRLNSVTPPELERIIHKALEKDRELRYQSAAEMRTDLRRLKRDSESKRVSAVTTVPPTAGARPRRRWLLPALALLLVVIAAAAYLLWRSRPPQVAPQSQWVQLTDYGDGATSPSISADGKFLTFIRGNDSFTTEGNIYVKLLPDGEPVQLTNDSLVKMDPVFTPDGARITYTAVERFDWQTWEVPVMGGQPRLLMHNAAVLHWLGPHEALYSEIQGTSGIHMGIATGSESRGTHRLVYLPASERGMAHRSYPSPDGKNVLIAEMDSPEFLPCRVVPFDGSSAGTIVGPPTGHCIAAAWSADGRFVYLSTDASGTGFHLWRQRFPGGTPEQLTFGPTEEEGVAVAPDGKSLVTSVALNQSSMWLQDEKGQTQLSGEGFPYRARIAPDGTKAYWLLLRRGAHETGRASSIALSPNMGDLIVSNLADGTTERPFPDIPAVAYAISPDQKTALLVTPADRGAKLLVAPLDHRSAPHEVAGIKADMPAFLGNDEFMCRIAEGNAYRFYRMKLDGSERKPMFAKIDAIRLEGVSPDGKWASVWASINDASTTAGTFAYNIESGDAIRVCDACELSWTNDGRFAVLAFYFSERRNSGMELHDLWALPLVAGKIVPGLPPGGLSINDMPKLKGAFALPAGFVDYAKDRRALITQRHSQRNLYRIPLQ